MNKMRIEQKIFIKFWVMAISRLKKRRDLTNLENSVLLIYQMN